MEPRRAGEHRVQRQVARRTRRVGRAVGRVGRGSRIVSLCPACQCEVVARAAGGRDVIQFPQLRAVVVGHALRAKCRAAELVRNRIRLRLPHSVERCLERLCARIVGRGILFFVHRIGGRSHPRGVVIVVRAVEVVSGITATRITFKIAGGRACIVAELVAEIRPVERFVRPRGEVIAGSGEAVGKRRLIIIAHCHRRHRAASFAVAVEVQFIIVCRPVRIEHLGLRAGAGRGTCCNLGAAVGCGVPAVERVARARERCQRRRRVFRRRADRHHVCRACVTHHARCGAGLGQVDSVLRIAGVDAGARAAVIHIDCDIALERRAQGKGMRHTAIAEILMDSGRERVAVFVEQLPDERRAAADRRGAADLIDPQAVGAGGQLDGHHGEHRVVAAERVGNGNAAAAVQGKRGIAVDARARRSIRVLDSGRSRRSCARRQRHVVFICIAAVIEIIDNVGGVLGIVRRERCVRSDRHCAAGRKRCGAVFPAVEGVAVLRWVTGPGLAARTRAVGAPEGHGLGLVGAAFGKAAAGSDPAARRRKGQGVVVRRPVRIQEQILRVTVRRLLALRNGDCAHGDRRRAGFTGVRDGNNRAGRGKRPTVERVACLDPCRGYGRRGDVVVVVERTGKHVVLRYVRAVGVVIYIIFIGRPLRGERDVVRRVAPLDGRAVVQKPVELTGAAPVVEAVAGPGRRRSAPADRVLAVVDRGVAAVGGVDRVGMDAVVGGVGAVVGAVAVGLIRHLVFVRLIPQRIIVCRIGDARHRRRVRGARERGGRRNIAALADGDIAELDVAVRVAAAADTHLQHLRVGRRGKGRRNLAERARAAVGGQIDLAGIRNPRRGARRGRRRRRRIRENKELRAAGGLFALT